MSEFIWWGMVIALVNGIIIGVVWRGCTHTCKGVNG